MCTYLNSKYHQKKYFSTYAYLDYNFLYQLYQQLDQIAWVSLVFFRCIFAVWKSNYHHLDRDHLLINQNSTYLYSDIYFIWRLRNLSNVYLETHFKNWSSGNKVRIWSEKIPPTHTQTMYKTQDNATTKWLQNQNITRLPPLIPWKLLGWRLCEELLEVYLPRKVHRSQHWAWTIKAINCMFHNNKQWHISQYQLIIW